jgi:hypothetical protein
MQVRTFLQLPVEKRVVADDTRSTLARLVEAWAFQELLLEQGRAVVQARLLEMCVAVARLQLAAPAATLPPSLLGNLDSVAGLVESAFAFRKQVMATLRSLLPLRQLALLLVIQVPPCMHACPACMRLRLHACLPASTRTPPCRRSCWTARLQGVVSTCGCQPTWPTW